MNESDKKFFEFCGDIRSILSMSSSYAGLKKLEDESWDIFYNELYSNINVQDDKGNTFLHYVLSEGQFDWGHALISKGANPLVINLEGKSAIQMIRLFDGRSVFFKKYECMLSANEFMKNTKNFALPFKEFLLKNLTSRSYSFSDKAALLDFLNVTNLATNLNTTHLIMNNHSFRDAYEKSVVFFDIVTPECAKSNALFLKLMLQFSKNHRYTSHKVSHIYSLLTDNDFFRRNIELDHDFDHALLLAIDEVEISRKSAALEKIPADFLCSMLSYAVKKDYLFSIPKNNTNPLRLDIKEIIKTKVKSKILFDKVLLNQTLPINTVVAKKQVQLSKI